MSATAQKFTAGFGVLKWGTLELVASMGNTYAQGIIYTTTSSTNYRLDGGYAEGDDSHLGHYVWLDSSRNSLIYNNDSAIIRPVSSSCRFFIKY